MHITLNDFSSPGFSLFQTSTHFMIQTNPKVLSQDNILSINRLTSKSKQISQKQFFDFLKQKDNSKENVKKTKIWAIYGIIVVQETPYLAVITDAVKITSSNRKNHIYEITDIAFIDFDPYKQQVPANENQKKILQFIKENLVKNKFYFSYSEDLTLCFKKKMRKNINEVSDSKFFWNQKNTQFLSLQGLKQPWIIPIIQGYVGTISQNNLQYRIICRRSKHMSGTRYNCRGINLSGFASNFAQIQQRIQFKNLIFSHVMLRGSVPIFWRQQNGVYQIQFPHHQDHDYKGLKNHYDDIISDYQCAINTINLLSQNKSHQKSLSQRYNRVLMKYSKNFYYEFDFNRRTDAVHEQINKFVKLYQQKQSITNFQSYDFVNDKKISQQDFIPRINCLDCVDRTNVICCRLGQIFLQKVMEILNFSKSQSFIPKYLDHWAALGNKISEMYCGTSSVSEHLTLKQEPSYWSIIKSSMRSFNRFINASQADQWKQQCNKYLLNEHQKSKTDYFIENICKNQINSKDYCTYLDVNTTIITWNVGAISPNQVTESDRFKMANRIFGKNNQNIPDIIFITLQQIIQLVPYNVITNDHQQAKQQWQKVFLQILTNHLNPHKHAGLTYRLFFSQALVGIASFLFVKNSLDLKKDVLNKINKKINYEVRRGYGGNLGNKGSIVSCFTVFDSLIINFSSHLAAGDQKKNQRLEDIKAILQSLNQTKQKYQLFQNADYIFFTGDLNFRLGCTDQYTRQLIEQQKKLESKKPQIYNTNNEAYSLYRSNAQNNNTLKQLFKQDQINDIYLQYKKFKKFQQYPVYFYPTYRYIKGQNQHDSKRKPGWCDRIFYYSKYSNQIICMNYSSIDQINTSDHRAVIGEFKLKLRSQNKQKKKELIQNYMKNMKQEPKMIHEPQFNFPKSRYNYG